MPLRTSANCTEARTCFFPFERSREMRQRKIKCSFSRDLFQYTIQYLVQCSTAHLTNTLDQPGPRSFLFTCFQEIRYCLHRHDQLFPAVSTNIQSQMGDLWLSNWHNCMQFLSQSDSNCTVNISQPLYITCTVHCSWIKGM